MELEKLIKKSLAKKLHYSLRVFVVGAILTFIFFIMLIDSLKTYHSEVSILINTKKGIDAARQAQIVSNIAQLSETLAFYDRLLKFNPGVRDVAAGLSNQQRKTIWNKMLSIERSAVDSSVIKLEISASHQADSEQLAIKAARTLFDTSALYYNVKTELDLRIIDGPITRVQLPNLILTFIFSLLAGFGISIILQHLSFSSEKFSLGNGAFLKRSPFFDLKKPSKISAEEELESLNKLYQNEQSVEPFLIEDDEEPISIPTFDEKFQEIKKITKQLEPDKYPNFPEMPVRAAQKASAPDNLPIAEDVFLSENIFNTDQEVVREPNVIMEPEEPVIDQPFKEPTPAELKERLNKLLRGEL